jgi:hypothetical protein
LAGELLGRRDLGRDTLAILADHRRRDMELPDIAKLSPGEAKRSDMAGEPGRAY